MTNLKSFMHVDSGQIGLSVNMWQKLMLLNVSVNPYAVIRPLEKCLICIVPSLESNSLNPQLQVQILIGFTECFQTI